MDKTPAPASFLPAPADAVVNKPVHRKDRVSCGVTGSICSDANERAVGTYSDPHGTVFIDRESHAGAWVKAIRDGGGGEWIDAGPGAECGL